MTDIGSRKADHLQLCATGDVGFRSRTTLLECVRFVHDALPELHADEDVDAAVTLLGVRLRAPLVIAAMTGGTELAGRINRDLAGLAEELGLGFGLGSQRAMLKRSEARETFDARAAAPTTLVLGNLGVVQAAQMTTTAVAELAASVGANALCVHLNPAMEIVQPEGDRDFRGGLDAIARLTRELPIPVVVKETGCGLGAGTLRRLHAAGVRHVDVSGAGGTSWVGVETKRAEAAGDAVGRALGEAFWDWGVPTAASVAAAAPVGFETIVATGGVASGLDAARAIALGASAAGIARPVLRAWHDGGVAGARRFLEGAIAELRAVMLLTGSRTVADLQRADRILTGELLAWTLGGAHRPEPPHPTPAPGL